MIEATFISAMLAREAKASASLDGQTHSLPRFRAGQSVWVMDHPAEVLSLIVDHDCPAHPGEYGYRVLLTSASRGSDGWPYCESQLNERD